MSLSESRELELRNKFKGQDDPTNELFAEIDMLRRELDRFQRLYKMRDQSLQDRKDINESNVARFRQRTAKLKDKIRYHKYVKPKADT